MTFPIQPPANIDEVSRLLNGHAKVKKVRGRGDETQGHMAAVRYLKELDIEMEEVMRRINQAWSMVDGSGRDFRKCIRHADHAQQRLHRVIRRLGKVK